MTINIIYHGREWKFVARHEDMGVGYVEYYCLDTNEAMNVWDDGLIEIFECV